MTTVVSQTQRRHTQWKPQEIKSFLSRARRVYSGPSFDIRLAAHQNPTQARLLIVTPRKMGNAPQRNLFKRRIKAIFHEQQLALCGYDIAIFGKPGADTVPFAELCTIVVAACKKS
jgi:ribonuclease P protein component